MNHLLYSSNEMYSSTELIRKSKTIFDKIINEEIDKAIILRDGKPSFMLLDFEKYEKIMLEYDKLKATSNKKQTKKVVKEVKIEEESKVDIDDKPNISKKEEIYVDEKDKSKELIVVKKISPAKVTPPAPSFEFDDDTNLQEEDLDIEEEMKSLNERSEDINNIDKEDTEEQPLQDIPKKINEDEIKEGLGVLEDLDFDDEFRKEVERQVRAKKQKELNDFYS